MEDKNGVEINRGQVISIIGDFEGVAVDQHGQPRTPHKTFINSFDGTEVVEVYGTRDGETCLFIYNSHSYEVDVFNKDKIEVLKI